jgi:hypothetical protein
MAAAAAAAADPLDLSGGNPFKNANGKYKTITQMKGSPIGDALDYSFVGLNTLEDMLHCEPTSGTKLGNPSSVGPTTCVRVPNNSISSIDGLNAVLAQLVEDPAKLFWLDISCNQISSLCDELENFPDLRVLNVHGNGIATVAEVRKICKLPLKSLTIHGNPVEEKKDIKNFIISMIPTLEKLNFCPVTPRDRDNAMTWKSINIDGKRRAKANK